MNLFYRKNYGDSLRFDHDIFESGMPYINFVKTGFAQVKMGQSKEPGNPLTSLETKQVRLAEDFLRKKLAPYRLEGEFVKEEYKIGDETLQEIVAEAREFLRIYSTIREEAAQLAKCEPTGELKQPNEEIRNLYRELCEIREQIDSLEHKKEYLEDRLKLFVGDALGIDGMLSWKTMSRSQFDRENFQAQHPELYERFTKESRVRYFKIIPPK